MQKNKTGLMIEMKKTIKKVMGLAILTPAILMLSLSYQDVNAENPTIPSQTEALSVPKATANGSVVNASMVNMTGGPGITVTATPNVTASPTRKRNATTPATTPSSTKTPDKNTKMPNPTPNATPHATVTKKPNKTTPTPTPNTTNMTTSQTPNATMTPNITATQEPNTSTPMPAPFQELNFVLVSDTHTSDKAQNTRFINTIFETNKIPGIDAMVITGDVVNEPTVENYETANIILGKLNVSHLLIIGNHDGNESFFKENTGQEPERIEIIKGYQIIFVGMKNDQWSFDFSRANKDLPTIIFVHGPAWGINGKTCEQTWEELGYACNMSDKLGEFSNLLAVVAGHVHMSSKQETNGVLYLTLNNLEGTSPADNFVVMTIKNGKVSLKQIAI